MFKISSSFILGAVAMLACATVASAGPAPLDARAADATPTIKVCTGSTSKGCVVLPVIADNCINFTGGMTFLNKEVSTAVIPGGLVCTFFKKFGCLAGANSGDVVLTGGTYIFFHIQGPSGEVNFNDKTSSLSCSPAAS